MESLRSQSYSITERKKDVAKRIKTEHMWNHDHWMLAAEQHELNGKLHRVNSQMALLEANNVVSDSQQKAIEEQAQKSMKIAEICRAHAQTLLSNVGKPAHEKIAFWWIFCGWSGLVDRKVGLGGRTTIMQSQLRATVIDVYQLQHPKRDTVLWDPFIGDYVSKERMIAAHIMPSSYGEDLMATIFGVERKDELHSPHNCLLMNTALEKTFDMFLWTLVPAVAEPHTREVLLEWHKAPNKQYRIRVMHPNHDRMKELIDISGRDQRLRDLDGKIVQFRSNFRPRARYLYLHYCMTSIKNSTTSRIIIEEEKKQKFWGSAGRYYKSNFLVGMSQFMGHEYEYLFEGDDDDEVHAEGEDAPVEADHFAAAALLLQPEPIKDGDDEDEGDMDV